MPLAVEADGPTMRKVQSFKPGDHVRVLPTDEMKKQGIANLRGRITAIHGVDDLANCDVLPDGEGKLVVRVAAAWLMEI